ncbi:hypothetical protein N473_17865 [Pseudoalteromonas luteoviolacea CPMOR-1]|uniref:Uncharacterized protein n=1 Tax=Pseudoalteromonas luteoviolacea CPMOR-1 TaxID=1365248 RepID=A0A162BK67_9GAMM|nr:hypothetical protein N473_17865 [Pseudoalteromonas luteoviolacea CPMOR-1]
MKELSLYEVQEVNGAGFAEYFLASIVVRLLEEAYDRIFN